MIDSNYRPYLAPLLRYSDLLAKNRNFFTPSRLAPSFGVTLFEFMEKLYGSRVFHAAEGEDLVIQACTVFD